MRIAVMQPYIFPYIGYFQLIQASDIFVFYDDVNYIKGGWINRNRILLNGKDAFLTIPCKKISPNKTINEIEIDRNHRDLKNVTKTIQQAYAKAPYFKEFFPIIQSVFDLTTDSISVLAEYSIKTICKYLDLSSEFFTSSVDFAGTKGLERSDRLIQMAKISECNTYINSIGGKELYEKEYFLSKGISLKFLKPGNIEYNQFQRQAFVPWLSVIDVLMFNSREDAQALIKNYDLS